ncbi:MAG: ABC transporter permease, partial [Treponema sp.]|nr:ABC transporter permease [Treponema sp.]
MTLIVISVCVAGIFYTPFDPDQMDTSQRFLPPDAVHLLGTDNFGRDVFSRIVKGSFHTLLIAVCTVAISAAAGAVLGLLASYSNALAGGLVMRIMDIISSLPGLLAALTSVAILGNSSLSLCIALTFLFIPGFTRVMRNGALQYKQLDFILAERLLGARMPRIIFIHIFPNIAHALLCTA